VVVFNVGDSRTYRCSGQELTAVTADHSLVAELVRQGRLSADDAPFHPARNVVTRSLGLDEGLDVDVWVHEPEAGTTYLMCSDGLVNELSDAMILAVVAGAGDPQAKADELVRLSLEAGARDNTTAVLVTIVATGDAEGAAADV
jgi:protein phosphatase